MLYTEKNSFMLEWELYKKWTNIKNFNDKGLHEDNHTACSGPHNNPSKRQNCKTCNLLFTHKITVNASLLLDIVTLLPISASVGKMKDHILVAGYNPYPLGINLI